MAVITPQSPSLAFVSRNFGTLTSGTDNVPLAPNSRYLLHFKNTTAGALTPVIDDPTSVLPAGAPASTTWADVNVGPLAASTGEGYVYIPNSDRFRDNTGVMNIAGGSGVQLSVIGPL